MGQDPKFSFLFNGGNGVGLGGGQRDVGGTHP